ncbi:hypothetical protein BMS3Abin04_02555 [bacterium BMS3Abin04]|nr:hypothetical protein BMS3Abin04_02555 [bacterium BMS3Abin04]
MKIVDFILLFFLSFLLVSCNEDFSPFGKEKEEIILNCVLKSDNPFQTAYLGRSFMVTNFNPASDKQDRSIRNGYIRIWYQDSVKIFSDTILTIQNNSTNGVAAYYNKKFVIQPNTQYEIEAEFDNGRKLHATTTTPKEIKFLPNRPTIPPENGNSVSVGWVSDNSEIFLYKAARYTIVYFKNENGKRVRYVKEVPYQYILENGNYIPFFPEPSYDNKITVSMATFDRALREISEGDPNKSNYTILGFILEVLVYDKNLTRYYASKADLSSSFTISINENDFSNIQGGRGIFGSFIKKRSSLKFNQDYIRSFGYLAGLK